MSINVQSNAPQVMPAALYYELEVFHEATSGKQLSRFLDGVWKDLEGQVGSYIDSSAATNPGRLHHVYEWGGVGVRGMRLWRLKRLSRGNDGFQVGYHFVQSKKKAPIHPTLATPGPTGKRVTKTGVFKNKAIVMEMGTPVNVRPVTGKYLAIPTDKFRGYKNKRGIAFTSKTVRVKNPGGKGVQQGFSRTLSGYFMSGLATKNLKRSGAFDRPAQVIKMAGEDIPVQIRKASIHQRISRSQAEAMAKAKVAQKAAGVY